MTLLIKRACLSSVRDCLARWGVTEKVRRERGTARRLQPVTESNHCEKASG